ncbi:hypothetical protein EB796_020517 [Bugula neritina]|uniref:Uncharacterized protein n=1 Tax=Bugula neritina TaxID=10212 RepID=A0A7J7J6M2_BUGNE|nr:hypothetical protein EB796_020517 [Bugula neritina]
MSQWFLVRVMEKAASTCESENSFGVLMFKACFTEAQQLLRIENLLKDITVIPRNSTCGNPPSNYCRLEEDSNDCEQLCDATTPLVSHPVTMAVDALMSTWWQSISWLSYPIPLEITFTLSFNKLYRLTDDLVVTFHSARPRSMVIERSIDNGVTWETWQYYSKDCLTFFNIPPSSSLGDDSQAIICSQSYSDTLPYSGGNVVFDVLSRYQIYLGAEFNDITSLYQSYNSTNWQRFLQFTDIRLNLLYPATDGEELNAGINLLKYYYAISNIDITAVCSCNLHASSCRVEGRQTLCECRHNTAGINCEQCLPLYNNREWRPGYYLPVGQGEANECQECECNNHADACIYNRTLGHGVCLDCRDSTIGPFCNTCADGFYSNSTLPLNSTDICIECLCDTSGTVAGDIKCDEKGVCACKDNVIGDKCDTCAPHYYGLNTYGECLPCKCTEFGTISGSVCDDDMGQCHCKVTTFGRTCSQCIESYYSFPSAWDEECLACNCVLGSSTNSHCSEDTGQCDCLPNLEGRTCSLVKSGFYLPSPLIEFGLDSTDCSVVYESMEQSSQWLSTARQQQVLPVACGSTGHVIYSVTVDFPQIHHLFRKYVLGIRYRSPSPSTLSLAMFAGSGCSYGQEVNLNLTIPASQNFSLHFSEHLLELTTNCQYDITVVTHAINESITLHTLVLAADWSQFSVYNEIGGANETDLCYDWLLSERNDSRCRLLVHSSMSELYGGAKAPRMNNKQETC